MGVENFDYKSWLDDFKCASRERNSDDLHSLRIEIYQDTIKYVENGGYDLNGNFVKISNDNLLENSDFFTTPQVLENSKTNFKTNFSVVNADCLDMAKVLSMANFNPCVLNLANRQVPGGGALSGCGAQEENLFRRTNLFKSLYQFSDDKAEKYGIKRNKNNSYPLDRDTGGIYSPNIVCFRDTEKNGYRLLSCPFKTAIITVPAINNPDLESIDDKYYKLVDKLVEPTKNKIRTILRIGGKYKHDSLILGAFGCGAFKNPPNHIAELFKEVFDENEFKDRFKLVVFAIFEDHNSGHEHNPDGNVLPFSEVFE